MIEITSTSTRKGTRKGTIKNVTIAFQSQNQFWSIVLTNSHCPQLERQLLYQVGDLQLPNDLREQHNIELSNQPNINVIIE